MAFYPINIADIREVTRLFVRDVIKTPGADGRVWKEAELIIAANMAVPLLKDILTVKKYGELLGKTYEEFYADGADGVGFYSFTDLGIKPDLVTGVWVQLSNAPGAEYKRCRPANVESQTGHGAGGGTADSPTYEITALEVVGVKDMYLIITPAFEDDVSSGIVMDLVNPSTPMSESDQEPDLPEGTRYFIPFFMAYLLYLSLDKPDTADGWYTAGLKAIQTRMQAIESIAELREGKAKGAGTRP
jgi:hypothetical protein